MQKTNGAHATDQKHLKSVGKEKQRKIEQFHAAPFVRVSGKRHLFDGGADPYVSNGLALQTGKYNGSSIRNRE